MTSAMSPGAGTEEGLARLRLGPKQPNPESDQRDEQAPGSLELSGLGVQRSWFCEIGSAASLLSSCAA